MRGESPTPETCELDEDNLFLDLPPKYTISMNSNHERVAHQIIYGIIEEDPWN
jgi:hypothetical protein